ncbi:hypothetical protein, conserved [Eimeria praecox]|uniref:START domain-containing protein n=1 Tax=Eimeria praecox TaxID=51316 RepID=U6G9D2_9EIME|nr:hypothetical protein, conserved [Eimeria praecox]
MAGRTQVKNGLGEASHSSLGCPLAALAIEKEIHNHLRHLERHLDAFLLIEQLKQRLKGKGPSEGASSSHFPVNAKTEDGLDAAEISDLLDNDPEIVETAFRRHMVAEVYRDLDKPECLERLDSGAPQTAELIQQLRKQEVVNDGSNLKIQLRNYSDNPDKISVRLEGVVAAPLICILSVLNEVDHFSNWVPYFTKPFKLGLRKVENERLGRVDQMVQFHIDFPWPFANRDACFEVFAVDDFERNSQIVVKMITLDNACKTPRQTMTIPDPARRVERILVDGSLVIKPLGPESSLLSLLWHENCGMRIPVFMLDFATKQAPASYTALFLLFARSAFDAFRTTCISARGGELQRRRSLNENLYSFIADRLVQVGLVPTSPEKPLAKENEGREDVSKL